MNRNQRTVPWIVACATGLFLLLAGLFIPRAGLDADEALFTNPLYRSMGADFELGVLHHKVPVMLIAYVGALKTLLCWPVLHFFGPSLYAVRLPVVLVGAATIIVFFLLAETLAGRVAATGATVLLATDPTFLLTDTFDWGPVALEHLILVSGCLALIRRRATLAYFLFGLGLWNKATFAWSLIGLIAAVLLAFWPASKKFLSERQLLLRCGAALIAGALPLLLFNLHRRAATLHASQGISTEQIGVKVHQLRGALDGSGLLGYIVSEDWATERPKAPVPVVDAGFHSSLFPFALVLAILAFPWWPAPRAGAFALVFCAVTFFAMAITRGAGTGIHHTVLLYPLPQLLVGIASSALRPRWASLLIAGLAISNLLVTDQYFVQFNRDGAAGNFTDAIAVLSESLATKPKASVYISDWGIDEPLVYLQHGRPLHYSPWLLVAEHPSAAQRQTLAAMVADPDGLFVVHAASREVFKGARTRLENIAMGCGYEKRVVETIDDSNSRPVFELWRFDRQPDFVAPIKKGPAPPIALKPIAAFASST